MLPTEHIIPCVKALEELVQNYNCTVVLCSATQPEVERFMSEGIKVTEICHDIEELYNVFNKTKVRFIGNKTMHELVQQLLEQSKVLLLLIQKAGEKFI